MSSPLLDVGHVVRTDAGLAGLWQPEGFADVLGLDDWEDRVSDNVALEQRIAGGLFVPLNVGGDGSWQVMVRSGGLSDREAQYLLVASDPYLLESLGVVELGGLENVGGYVGGGIRVPLAAGRYRVQVNLVDWDAEPGSRTSDGSPAADALADFVVLVTPEAHPSQGYRTSVETFERPS